MIWEVELSPVPTSLHPGWFGGRSLEATPTSHNPGKEEDLLTPLEGLWTWLRHHCQQWEAAGLAGVLGTRDRVSALLRKLGVGI